jgi:protein TonB
VTATAALLALACACAPAAPHAPARPRGVEDAEPVFLSESEVDAPAAPLAPIQPDYPAEARSRGLEGDVTLRVRVRADGRVVGFERLDGAPDDFARAAAEAIRAAGFRPGVRDGRPVSSTVTIRVRFRLD